MSYTILAVLFALMVLGGRMIGRAARKLGRPPLPPTRHERRVRLNVRG